MDKIKLVISIAVVFLLMNDGAIAQSLRVVNYDSLRQELEAMYDADQDIRRILVDSIGLESPDAGKYIGKMMEIDARNKEKIEAILERYGWMEQSKIGVKASEAIFYTVQHTDLAFMKKYFSQFQKLADDGEANPKLCAMMEDRLLMWEGKKQIYGSQANSALRSDKKYAIWPIENPEKVNELRRSKGFTTTVEENAKLLNAEYNPHQALPAVKH